MVRDGEKLHDPRLVGILDEALDLAERAVERYYAISPREWSRTFRYIVGSSEDYPDLPFHPGALAQIVEAERQPSHRPPLYVIVLRDEEILSLARRFGLVPVLAATLAHELVHLVRFASRRVPFDQKGPDMVEEERTVRRITREALAPLLPREALGALEHLTGGLGGD